MEVLVPIVDVIKGGSILWDPLKVPAWRDPGGPAIPHDIQRGGRHGPQDLSIRGYRNGGGSGTINRRFRTGHSMADRTILC